MVDIAVVILNYNGRHFLEKFLPSVLQYSSEAEVYVADNKSTDDSVDFLKKRYPSLRLIELEENGGYAAGYNRVLQRIDTAYYVLLNSDIEVSPNWIAPIINLMKENRDAAACQPKILDYNNRNKFEHAGAAGGFLDYMGYPYCRGRVLDTLEEDKAQYDDTAQVFWASGACLFIRSEVFHQLGGFDEDFFAHMEEIDLCWRINLSGSRVYCVPESRVYHVGGGTLAKSNPTKTYLNFHNNLLMIYKNTSGVSLAWKLPLRFCLDLAAGLKFWKDGSFEHFRAVVRAWRIFVSRSGRYRKKRYRVKGLRRNTPSCRLYRGLVPVRYYLKGLKTYTKLHS